MAKRNNCKLFQGTGVVVREPSSHNDTIVETAHAKELSALFFSLRDIFAGSIDYFDKAAFYGRLADAANRQVSCDDSFDSIREAAIAEARSIASETGKHLYFAYGSNMDQEQMENRCPDSLFAGTAVLEGYSFSLDSEGVATVLPKRGSRVFGALWLISDEDERSLDRYEGVVADCYRKEQCEVTADGTKLQVLVYISNRGMHDGETHRSGYMEKIVASAERLSFEPGYISMLKILCGGRR